MGRYGHSHTGEVWPIHIMGRYGWLTYWRDTATHILGRYGWLTHGHSTFNLLAGLFGKKQIDVYWYSAMVWSLPIYSESNATYLKHHLQKNITNNQQILKVSFTKNVTNSQQMLKFIAMSWRGCAANIYIHFIIQLWLIDWLEGLSV